MQNQIYDVIIIGGSYSGLAAAMSAGRALRQVLVIDEGKPCNQPTPHSHNFLTHDGKTPLEISRLALNDISKYSNITIYKSRATQLTKQSNTFQVQSKSGKQFLAKKIILAHGLKDILPSIQGLKECWGITALHCPYCHGYEVKYLPTGILANGEVAFEMAKMISNWTKTLTLFTNGTSTLNQEQTQLLLKNQIQIVETPIQKIKHTQGQINGIQLENNSIYPIQALYIRPQSKQSVSFVEELGCNLNEQGLIEVDQQQQTTIPGIYACGDNSSFRSVSIAICTGSIAGVMVNKALTEESFNTI